MKRTSLLGAVRRLAVLPVAAVSLMLGPNAAVAAIPSQMPGVDTSATPVMVTADRAQLSRLGAPLPTPDPVRPEPRRGEEAAALNPEVPPAPWLQEAGVWLFALLIGAAFLLVSPRRH